MAAAVFSDFVRAEPFSGIAETGSRAKAWFEDFELLCQHKGMNDNQKLATLPLLLKGPAKAWFRTLPEDTRNDLAALRTAFMEMYGNESSSKYVRIREFYGRKQTATEGARNYIIFMMEIAISLALTEIQAVQAIIGGLLPSIQAQVVKEAPENYQDLIRIATEAEMSQPKEDTSASLAKSVAALAEQIQQLSTRQESIIAAAITRDAPSERDNARGRSTDRRVQFRDESRDRAASRERYRDARPRHRTPDGSRERRPYSGSRQGYSAPRCHRCLSRDHLANACWAIETTCWSCNRRGHVQAACRSAKRQGSEDRPRWTGSRQ